jgi:hypothetical protein
MGATTKEKVVCWLSSWQSEKDISLLVQEHSVAKTEEQSHKSDEGTTGLYVCVQREEEFYLRPSIIIKTWRIGGRFRTLLYSQMTAT